LWTGKSATTQAAARLIPSHAGDPRCPAAGAGPALLWMNATTCWLEIDLCRGFL